MFSATSTPEPLVLRRSWPLGWRIYLGVHAAWFVLYAVLGKGFAYFGFPPLYAGEMLLAVGSVALLTSRRMLSLFTTPVGLLLSVFFAWQTICLAPYVELYGMDSLRDSVIWAYGIFACVVAAGLLRLPGLLRTILASYRKFAKFFLFVGPAAWILSVYFRDALPHWPETSVSIPLIKGNEYATHLAGIFAYNLGGIGNMSGLWTLLILVDALLGMNVRSGLLAFGVGIVVSLLLRPRPDRMLFIAAAGGLVLILLTALDFHVIDPITHRELSFSQLSASVESVFGDSGRDDLESTKYWRLNWWRTISNYTINGPYFWTGKGYGINLADSDGFQVGTKEEPLRSPHSSHLTFLARSGVPGFVLWVALQLTWAGLLLRAYVQARQARATEWVHLFSWILVYWSAFIVSAGFDVFLEGPMAGIPFWSVFGLGWGGEILFRSELRKLASGRVCRITDEGVTYARA